MWSKTYSIAVEGLKPCQVWQVWSDINKRPQWDIDIKSAKIEGAFRLGAMIEFESFEGKIFKMEIVECTPNKIFTDLFKLPLAKLYGIHTLEEVDGRLCIGTTIKITGLLSFLWGKLLGEKIFSEVPRQTELTIQLAREVVA